jgi:hypothetical protein
MNTLKCPYCSAANIMDQEEYEKIRTSVAEMFHMTCGHCRQEGVALPTAEKDRVLWTRKMLLPGDF